MQRLLFYIIYPLIWLLSKMPFPVLYFVSDFFFIIVYYIVGYRKELVLENLKKVFPNKDIKELKIIRKKFYHHFVDIFMEMIKTFTISEKELAKHYKFKNLSVLDDLAKKNKSVILLGSHYANWEWGIVLSRFVKHKFYVTYTRIENDLLDKKIRKSRERFDAKMLSKPKTIAKMAYNMKRNIPSIFVLLSDQSPQLKKTYYWGDFLGVRVPIHTGAEKLAKRNDLAVVYFTIKKIKRGYYEVEFDLLTETPREYSDYDLTDIYLRKAESHIYSEPSYYFWTHNRFKHSGKEEQYNKTKN